MGKITDIFDGLCNLIKVYRGNATRRTGIALIFIGGSWFGFGALGLVKLSWGDLNVSVDSSWGSPEIVTGLASVIVVVGLFLVVFSCLFSGNSKKRNTILIEHLGAGNINTTNDFSSYLPRGCVHDPDENIIVNQNQYIHDLHVDDPKGALGELLLLKRDISNRLQHVKNITLAYAGIAPIPFLFCAGYILSNRQFVFPLDWNRNDQKWHALTADKKNFYLEFVGPEKDYDAKEIAVAFPITFEIDSEVLLNDIGKMPLVRAELFASSDQSRVRTGFDLLSSQVDQKKCLKQFQDFLNRLHINFPNSKKIHLIISTQSSFAFQLGRQIVPKNHGEIWVYQYAKGDATSYPWAVSISTQQVKIVSNPRIA